MQTSEQREMNDSLGEKSDMERGCFVNETHGDGRG